MKTEHLILYRNMEYQNLLEEMDAALETGGMSGDVWRLANQLIELASKYGFEGNLWHCFLALCIANHENAYSISCEIRGQAGGSLDALAREDFAIFKELFDYDIRSLGGAVWELLSCYRPAQADSRVFNRRIRDRIVNLAVQLEKSRNPGEFQIHAAEFYREFIAPYKGALELWYQEHASLAVDFRIIFLTAWVIIFPESELPYRWFRDLPSKPEWMTKK